MPRRVDSRISSPPATGISRFSRLRRWLSARTARDWLLAASLLLLTVVAMYTLRARGYLRRKSPKHITVRTTASPALPRQQYAPDLHLVTRVVVQKVIGGAQRQWVYIAPTSPKAGRSYPVVFALHGDGGDGVEFQADAPFEEASAENAIVVYPTGLGASWDIETAVDNRDHLFMTAIVDHMRALYTIDSTRVYGTGYSSGAYFLQFMACERPGFFRAIASNAGSAPYGRAEKFANGFTRCKGQAPIPILVMHGTADYTVPLATGAFSADYWAYVNSCSMHEVETTDYPECVSYLGCPPGHEVAFCEIPKLGHWVWSQHAEAAWTFFRSHGGD
jgi:polyhydroxybutyrate depolymerase